MANRLQYLQEQGVDNFYDTIDQWKPTKICPFQLISGAYDVVNGAITDNVNINEETLYEKVFTGENSTILIWRDSTKLILKDSEQLPPYSPTDVKRDYQVGKSYDFYLNTDVKILASTTNTLRSLSTLTGFVAGDISEENIFDGYVLPTIEQFVYKFEIGQKYRRKDTQEVVYTEVSLTKISKIGTSDDIDQVFQLTNSLGEGYAWPISTFDSDGKEVLSLDQNKLQDDPIKYIQIEYEDPTIPLNVYMAGRPATYGLGQGKGFEEPRELFPYNFRSTDGNKLSGRISPSDYFLYSNNLSLTLDTYYESWVAKFLTKYSPESIRSFEGHFTDTDRVSTEATNPQLTNAYGKTYWDDWLIQTSEKTVNVLSPFAVSSFTYDPAVFYSMEELNIANVFRHQHIQKLPIQSTQTTPRVTTEIPILGILGKFIFLGTSSGWYQTDALRNRVDELGGFINKDYYQLLASEEFNESNTLVPLPLDAFGEGRAEAIFGIDANPTVWKFGLTDTFIIGSQTGTEYSTNLLGKDLNEDGVPPYLWNLGEYRPVTSPAQGFAIDAVISQAEAKTVIRMTAYNNNDDAVYSVRYETSGKRTGDPRDISTVFRTSIWSSEVILQVPQAVIPLPADLPETLTLEPNIPFGVSTEEIDSLFPQTGPNSFEAEETLLKEIDFNIVNEFSAVYPQFDIDNYNFVDIELEKDFKEIGILLNEQGILPDTETFTSVKGNPNNESPVVNGIFNYNNIRLDTSFNIPVASNEEKFFFSGNKTITGSTNIIYGDSNYNIKFNFNCEAFVGYQFAILRQLLKKVLPLYGTYTIKKITLKAEAT